MWSAAAEMQSSWIVHDEQRHQKTPSKSQGSQGTWLSTQAQDPSSGGRSQLSYLVVLFHFLLSGAVCSQCCTLMLMVLEVSPPVFPFTCPVHPVLSTGHWYPTWCGIFAGDSCCVVQMLRNGIEKVILSGGNGDDRYQKYMSKEKIHLFSKCLPSCSCGFHRT